MEYINLGKTSLKISRIGLGAWQFGGDAWGPYEYGIAKEVIGKAVELGINFIDTAAVYGRGRSEEFVGRAIRELGIREHVVIATKIPGDWHRYDDVLKAARRSRERLGVDVIDLLQLHWPACWHNVPICETMKAMEKLVEDGVIRFIGVSNYPLQLLEAARSCLKRSEIVSSQNRYNLIERDIEKELLPYLQREGITLIAWSPLAKGAVTGKYSPENRPKGDLRENEPVFYPDNLREITTKLIPVIKELASKYGKTPAQIALNWLVMHDNVVPIPGAKNAAQVVENAGAVGWRLSEDDFRRLTAASNSLVITYVTW
ncbi:aldo/keto reductase [Vulcanisaeta distributa]|uniref:Aldo/keto reductase n=1 Tax=Vulcanisaeta distributa (strain DSM 14429 / JCM 11212 / NBRC 100878 / IC-017) TaxID=572478 RepID=E1QR93_VULDI|nr:aldo/keto reductase [Vulcanisaeta distributa]ADN50590.1 aldo/keto reductase [Vulcanisaeta distributa DSM 14429]